MSKSVRRRRSRAVQHGAAWDEGYRLEATARGVGEIPNSLYYGEPLPVTVANPGKGVPTRIISGQGDVRLMPNGTLEISNHGRASGEAISLVVEF